MKGGFIVNEQKLEYLHKVSKLILQKCSNGSLSDKEKYEFVIKYLIYVWNDGHSDGFNEGLSICLRYEDEQDSCVEV